MKKKISVAKHLKLTEKGCRKEGIIVPKLKIGKKIKDNNQKMNKFVDEQLKDYFVLLDIGIAAIEEMHYICKRKSFVYAGISAKMVGQLLSMRTLLFQGQMDSVKSIYRTFHETMEVFFACLIDKDFSEAYGKYDGLYDNNEFWKNNINGNRLDRFINKLFDDADYPKESKKEYFKRRDRAKSFLSEAVHSSFNSVFSAYLMTTIDGKFSDNIYGKITTAYPLMMYDVLTDICLINAIFFRIVDSNKAYAFSKSDIVGKDTLAYHHFCRTYDTIYDFHYQELYKKGVDILAVLKDAHQEFLKIENEVNRT